RGPVRERVGERAERGPGEPAVPRAREVHARLAAVLRRGRIAVVVPRAVDPTVRRGGDLGRELVEAGIVLVQPPGGAPGEAVVRVAHEHVALVSTALLVAMDGARRD